MTDPEAPDLEEILAADPVVDVYAKGALFYGSYAAIGGSHYINLEDAIERCVADDCDDDDPVLDWLLRCKASAEEHRPV